MTDLFGAPVKHSPGQVGLCVWIDHQALQQLTTETMTARCEENDNTINIETVAASIITAWCDQQPKDAGQPNQT